MKPVSPTPNLFEGVNAQYSNSRYWNTKNSGSSYHRNGRIRAGTELEKKKSQVANSPRILSELKNSEPHSGQKDVIVEKTRR